jgi:hypothetical protein
VGPHPFSEGPGILLSGFGLMTVYSLEEVWLRKSKTGSYQIVIEYSGIMTVCLLAAVEELPSFVP